MVPDLDLARIHKWVAGRNNSMPVESRDEVRYEVDVSDRAITVLECRAPWSDHVGPDWTRTSICRFRYTKTRREWSLYWCDSSAEKFHLYDLARPTPHIDALVREVVDDPSGIFWG